MSTPPDQGRFDYSTDDPQTLGEAVRDLRFKIWWNFAMIAFPIAIIYGAVTMSPYYLGLGVAGTILFWWLKSRLIEPSSAADNSKSET